jgi:hypothetical protein
MSSLVFPTLPGSKMLAAQREPTYKTVIHEALSGKEIRDSYWVGNRVTYVIDHEGLRESVAAPAPYAAYNERSVLEYFHDTCKGSWDTFYFNDPATGLQVTVRFVNDKLDFKKKAAGLWTCQVSLITVV